MTYNIPSKPTLYKNRLYRSRLEARWACFFDLSEWKYEYEPSQVNKRNPDFILRCSSPAYSTSYTIVEVKPELYLTEEYKNAAYKAYYDLPAHIMFLSDIPFYYKNEYLVIGIGSQYYGDKGYGLRSELLNLEMKCPNDFGSSYMNYDGMMKGEVNRKMFLSRSYQDYGEIEFIQHRWNLTGNETMFLKPAYAHG